MDPAPLKLDELRRQRALIAQHLAWLDQQIRLCEPTEPTEPTAVPGQAVVGTEEPPPIESAAEAPDAPVDEPTADFDSLVAQEEPPVSETAIKAGCIALIVILGGLVIASVFALPYLLYFSGHGHHLLPRDLEWATQPQQIQPATRPSEPPPEPESAE